jgi:hypothetical protein
MKAGEASAASRREDLEIIIGHSVNHILEYAARVGTPPGHFGM